jgi:hypothetical protein
MLSLSRLSPFSTRRGEKGHVNIAHYAAGDEFQLNRGIEFAGRSLVDQAGSPVAAAVAPIFGPSLEGSL